jgi:hypothetical protein
MTLKGSCQCRGVAYEVDAIDGDIWNCHCQTCRKSHAAERNIAARVKRMHFRIRSGAGQLSAFESMPGKFRHFCSVCGSHIYAERPELPFVVIRAGTLDDDPGKQPTMDVWTSHARAWLKHREGLPDYPEAPPG